MKTAIYIEDGVVQLVLTPETDFEKNALKSFNTTDGVVAQIFSGSFYDCRGGWTRQKNYYDANYGERSSDINDQSLILRTVPAQKPEDPAQ